MAQVTITNLPQAQTLTGFESVPIVQNGVTVQTTTGAISAQPNLQYTFLTATQQPGLANSRYLAVGSGLQIIDGGAQGTMQVNLTGAASSLNSSANGIQVKTALGTLTARSITVGTGLTIANGDGVAANPLIGLGAFLSNFQSMSGSTGLVGVKAGLISALSIAGTSGNISVASGDGSSGNPTINLVSTAVTPGTYTLATLTVDQFGRLTSASNGTITSLTSFSAGITGLTPSVPTTGDIVLNGTLNIGHGGTNGTATPTAGGVSYGTGSAYGFTGAGTTGQVLTSQGSSAPIWATVAGSGTVTSVNATAGTGISVSGGPITTSGTLTITNTAPDQTVVLNNGTGINVTGTYPNFTISSTSSGGTVTNVTGTAPVNVANGTTTPVISMNVANATTNGYLTSADWNTFNNKSSTNGTVTNVSANGSSPLSVTNGTTAPVINITQANATTAGYLSSADWNTFNNKSSTNGTVTNVSANGSSPLSVTNGTTAPIINITQSSNTTDGYLSSADWNTFNGKQPAGSYLTAVTADSPLSGSGTSASHLVIAQATNTTSGYLSSTDWNTFNNKSSTNGTVTNVSGTGTVNGLSLSGTVTSSGNLTLSGTLDLSSPPAIGGTAAAAGTFTTLTTTGQANLAGSAAAPSFRATVGDNTPNTMWVEAKGASSSDTALYLGVGGTSAKPLLIVNNGQPISFRTTTIGGTGNEQLRVSHTSTAVNYVQVTGRATGNGPQISTQGSDANANLELLSKGNGAVKFFTGTSEQFRVTFTTGTIVNYTTATGNIASSSPAFGVAGTDTNIDLTLTPKGTGRVNITTSIKPKVNSAASVTSPLAWDSTSYDEYAITALANALTINADANASPADGQKMMFRFKDNGTARALTWTTGSTNSFRVVGVTLPTTTVANKLVYIGCIYNAADSRWDAVAVSQEA